MTNVDRPRGWRPLRPPSGATGISAFGRLARTHALSVTGDVLVTIALADSIFFGITPSDARPKVLLYLLITMAPFAVVAPLLGPWIDATSGGRRLMLMTAAAGRAAVAVLLIDDIDGLLMFPEAFVVLVLAKSHAVARSALVPAIVHDESELVEANSKLSMLSGVMSFLVGGPALLVLWLGGSQWVLGFAAIAFVGATVLAYRVPKVAVAQEPVDELERKELRSAGVLLAASAMGVLRGVVGFLTFHIAFLLRTQGESTWWFGVVVAVSAASAMLGAGAAAPLRRLLREEHILTGGLIVVAAVAVGAAYGAGGPGAATVMAAAVGVSAAAAKVAFDAIVQRDAPDANQGRSFARFETRFQMAWVVGALIPVIAPLPDWVGYVILAAAAGFAGVSYIVGQRATSAGPALPPMERSGA
jgi:hypothetical protein